jgi:hypothetical protein
MSSFVSSRWDTTYQTPNGPVRAIVTFNNDVGEYVLVDDSGNGFDTGAMTNVKYHVTSDTIWLITGSWSLQGEAGAFQFTGSGGPDDFTGGWFFDSPQVGGGTWNGHRIQ